MPSVPRQKLIRVVDIISMMISRRMPLIDITLATQRAMVIAFGQCRYFALIALPFLHRITKCTITFDYRHDIIDYYIGVCIKIGFSYSDMMPLVARRCLMRQLRPDDV